MRASEKTRRLTGLALMTAIIVVLQVVASFVKFGPFTITLALAPILIGAALYGPKAGACLGGVFGAVVLLACILGWDPGGAILWNANPFLTALVCLGKGILAGLAAGLGLSGHRLGRQIPQQRSYAGRLHCRWHRQPGGQYRPVPAGSVFPVPDLFGGMGHRCWADGHYLYDLYYGQHQFCSGTVD